MISRYRPMTNLIIARLKAGLVDIPVPVANLVFNAASQELADLQVASFPALGVLWLGFTPDSPPEGGPHILTKGISRWAVLVYTVSGTSPLDFGPAADLLEAVEEQLIDYELDYNPSGETPCVLYLEDERTENIEGMTLILAGYYAALVTKTGG